MDYGAFVRAQESLLLGATGLKASSLPPLTRSGIGPFQRIMILSPHPDDECLVAGLPLRALEEWGSEVSVLPFGFGSKPERRSERLAELTRAVAKLGFRLIRGTGDPSGLPELGAAGLAEVLKREAPDALILPHLEDGHETHRRCARLGREVGSIYAAASGRKLDIFETGYWQDLPDPDVLVPLASEQVIRMGEALMEHVGEVKRNPYHLSLPAHLIDQARKGSERVGGAGARPDPETVYAALYRRRQL
jgi:LmbE family N-acetylglucosaminyl deacetylase